MTEASSASDGGDTELTTPASGDTGDVSGDTEGTQGSSDAASTEGAKPDVTDPATSSPADGPDPAKGPDEQSPTSMVDAVTAVLDKDKKDADPSPAESGQDAQAKGADAEGEKAKGKDDEAGDDDKDPPFHHHPRWQELIAERDDLKTKLESASEAEEAITRVETVLKEQNLSVDEFNRTLVLAGFVKNDPAKALEALEPLVQRLREVTGHTLSADIQQQVDQGHMTEDAALQLAQARAQAQAAQVREQTQSQRFTAERESTQKAQLVEGVSRAATEWENSWKASDPDYAVKASRVLEKVELKVLRNEFPTSPEKVREVCETIKKEVEAELRAFLPKKGTVTPNQTNSAKGTGSTAPEHKTMEDAIIAAL